MTTHKACRRHKWKFYTTWYSDDCVKSIRAEECVKCDQWRFFLGEETVAGVRLVADPITTIPDYHGYLYG